MKTRAATVALLALLPGCMSAPPTALLATATIVEAESTRWVRAAGTPWAEALTWRSRTMNLWVEQRVLVPGFSTVCLARAVVVHRARLPPAWALGDTIRGALTTLAEDSDPVSAGSFWIVTEDDTMRGEATATFPTSCGVATDRVPLTLVRRP